MGLHSRHSGMACNRGRVCLHGRNGGGDMETQGLGCILVVWVVFLNLLHIGQICHDCDLLHSVSGAQSLNLWGNPWHATWPIMPPSCWAEQLTYGGHVVNYILQTIQVR